MIKLDNKTGIFWLHIKKSAGQSTRRMLDPLYKSVDRSRRPENFLQAAKEDHNDILNNYRILLGQYQFKRALFAARYLYPDNFGDLYRFAFSREPVDRALSQFFYLWHKPKTPYQLRLALAMVRELRFTGKLSYDFDRFLDAVGEARQAESIFKPYDLHFQTHVAAMWDDITDESGTILLDDVFRLEDLAPAISAIRQAFGASPLRNRTHDRHNRSTRHDLQLSQQQLQRLEQLFEKDFVLYHDLTYRGFAC